MSSDDTLFTRETDQEIDEALAWLESLGAGAKKRRKKEERGATPALLPTWLRMDLHLDAPQAEADPLDTAAHPIAETKTDAPTGTSANTETSLPVDAPQLEDDNLSWLDAMTSDLSASVEEPPTMSWEETKIFEGDEPSASDTLRESSIETTPPSAQGYPTPTFGMEDLFDDTFDEIVDDGNDTKQLNSAPVTKGQVDTEQLKTEGSWLPTEGTRMTEPVPEIVEMRDAVTNPPTPDADETWPPMPDVIDDELAAELNRIYEQAEQNAQIDNTLQPTPVPNVSELLGDDEPVLEDLIFDPAASTETDTQELTIPNLAEPEDILEELVPPTVSGIDEIAQVDTPASTETLVEEALKAAAEVELPEQFVETDNGDGITDFFPVQPTGVLTEAEAPVNDEDETQIYPPDLINDDALDFLPLDDLDDLGLPDFRDSAEQVQPDNSTPDYSNLDDDLTEIYPPGFVEQAAQAERAEPAEPDSFPEDATEIYPPDMLQSVTSSKPTAGSESGSELIDVTGPASFDDEDTLLTPPDVSKSIDTLPEPDDSLTDIYLPEMFESAGTRTPSFPENDLTEIYPPNMLTEGANAISPDDELTLPPTLPDGLAPFADDLTEIYGSDMLDAAARREMEKVSPSSQTQPGADEELTEIYRYDTPELESAVEEALEPPILPPLPADSVPLPPLDDLTRDLRS